MSEPEERDPPETSPPARRRRYDGAWWHKAWEFGKDARNDVWTLILTVFVGIALINAHNAQQKSYSAQQKAQAVAAAAATKAKVAAAQTHDACLRSRSAIPTLVKVMKAQQYVAVHFPSAVPHRFYISNPEIQVYARLIPKSCPR